MPYGIHRGELIPSESHWSVKKTARTKKESNPNVNAGVFFIIIIIIKAYLLP